MSLTQLRFSKKKREKYERELSLASGIRIEDNLRVDKNGFTELLIIKMIAVFLAVFGSLHAFMSGFSIEYDIPLVIACTAICSVIFCLANINSILLSFTYLLAGWFMMRVIDDYGSELENGFRYVTQNIYPAMLKYYELPSEEISRSVDPLSWQITVLILVILSTMITALLTGRFVHILLIIFLQGFSAILPMFYGGKPDSFALVAMSVAYILISIMKFSTRYLPGKTKFTPLYLRKRIIHFQGCDGKVIGQYAFINLAFISAILLLFSLVFTPSAYDKNISTSSLNKDMHYSLREMMIRWTSYRNGMRFNDRVGGLLGSYADFRPDMKTDITVTTVPYTMERMYLKGYNGSIYKYGDNRWYNVSKQYSWEHTDMFSLVAKYLKRSDVYLNIKVENVDTWNGFASYYSNSEEQANASFQQDDITNIASSVGNNYTIKTYPLTETTKNQLLYAKDFYIFDIYQDYVDETYLYVPSQLEDKIKELCQKEGLLGEDYKQTEENIENYFQNNFKYNLRSGSVPWGKDFVEHFLFTKKEGVCSHFATAATLMYRAMGIPARYTEGYCVDYIDFLAGSPQKEELLSSYSKGLPTLTDVPMTANLSDFNSHAWVEIYVDNAWIPVDPTPSITQEELQKQLYSESGFDKAISFISNLIFGNKDMSLDLSGIGSLAPKLLKGIALTFLFLAAVFIISLILIYVDIYILEKRGKYKKAIYKQYMKMYYTGLYSGYFKGNESPREVSYKLKESGYKNHYKLLENYEKILDSKDDISLYDKSCEYIKGAYTYIYKNTNIFKYIKARIKADYKLWLPKLKKKREKEENNSFVKQKNIPFIRRKANE